MSRATVTTFGRGVSFVASGETGTQANEFEAAIKSVTSSTTVGAVFVYDTRNDSDGGAWRRKSAGLSWFDEDLNTATRGGRREFPSVALIVADNATDETLTVYDLDDPAMPVWMVFNVGGSSPAQYMLGETAWGNINAVTALNGRIYLGRATGGLVEIDFVNDYANRVSTAGQHRYGSIANRNADSGDHIRDTSITLVNIVVNDVAATVLDGAEIGALDLPIPTVAVATDGGVSVIHANGSVYDIRPSNTTYAYSNNVAFTEDNRIVFSADASSNLNVPRLMYNQPIPYADDTSLDWGTTNAANKDFAVVAGFVPNVAISGAGISKRIVGNKFDAFASANGLSIAKRNTGNFTESLVANVTSDYNTGYMLGDIRFAGLANHWHNDRSVKGNNLSENGSISNAVVATDAELRYYYGFDASNYLSKDLSSDTDFDFGTGDFSVMVWLKTSDTTRQTVFQWYGSGSLYFQMQQMESTVNSGEFRFQMADGGGAIYATSTSNYDGNWHQVVGVRDGDVLRIYVDGKLAGTQTGAASMDFDSASTTLYVGRESGSSNTMDGGLSLLRFSATAPTPQQVADIYRAEAPLFRAGAKCLLQSDSGSPNLVNDLSYDSTTGLLHAYQGGTNTAETRFKGLEAVDSYGAKSDGWSASGATGGVAAGGVKATYRAAATGGVIVDLPAIDVRGDINTADSKLPDDGKLHFTGVTTDATKLKIPILPLAINESATVDVKFKGQQYNTPDGEYLQARIVRTIGRLADGSMSYRTATYTIIDETTSSMDADISAVGTNITAEVTGKAATRIVWEVEVEVQRISEKQYER